MSAFSPGAAIGAARSLSAAKGTNFLGLYWDAGGEEVDVDGRSTLYASNAWDTCWIAGMQMPGIVEILDGLTEIGIDNKKPDGADGSTITVKGYKPGTFEVSVTVWTAHQMTQLFFVKDRVWRRPHKRAALNTIAVDIWSPALGFLGISSCVVQGVTFLRPTSGFEGAKTMKFKCIENLPAGKKRVTASAGRPPVNAHKDLQLDPENNMSRVDDDMSRAPAPLNAGQGKPSKSKRGLSSRGAPTPPTNGSY